jgi:hypothetical protein
MGIIGERQTCRKRDRQTQKWGHEDKDCKKEAAKLHAITIKFYDNRHLLIGMNRRENEQPNISNLVTDLQI